MREGLRLLRNETGLTMPEVLTAVAIVMVLGLSVAIGENFGASDMGLAANAACNNAALAAVGRFDELGTHDHIASGIYLTFAANLGTVNVGTQLSLQEQQIFGAGYTPDPIIDQTVVPPVFNNSEFIISGTTALQRLYNSDNTYCTGATANGPGKDITALVFPIGTPQPAEVQTIYLQIKGVDLTTNLPIAGGCAVSPLYAAPGEINGKPVPGYANPSNNAAVDGYLVRGNSDLGFQAVFTANVTTYRGNTQCQASRIYSHQRDATIVQAPSVSSSSCPGASGNLRMDIDLTAPINVTAEPGAVLLCQDSVVDGFGNASNDPLWYPCQQVPFIISNPSDAAVGLNVTPATVGSTATLLKLHWVGLANAHTYSLKVASVDSAGNKSTALLYGTGTQLCP